MADSKLSITLKGKGRYQDPWLVMYADSVEEAQSIMEAAHAKDLFTAIGRAAEAFERGVAMGGKLDARTIEVSSTEDVEAAAEKVVEEPKKATKAAPRTRKAKPAESPETAEKKDEAPAARPDADKLADGEQEAEKPAPKPIPKGVPKPKWMQ